MRVGWTPARQAGPGFHLGRRLHHHPPLGRAAPTPERAVSRGMFFFPFLLFFTYSVFCLYVVLKNPQTEIKDFAAKTPLPQS